jgi:hypothetical protein
MHVLATFTGMVVNHRVRELKYPFQIPGSICGEHPLQVAHCGIAVRFGLLLYTAGGVSMAVRFGILLYTDGGVSMAVRFGLLLYTDGGVAEGVQMSDRPMLSHQFMWHNQNRPHN